MTCGKCGCLIVADMPGEMLCNPCAWGAERREDGRVAVKAFPKPRWSKSDFLREELADWKASQQ